MTQPASRGIEATLAALDLSRDDETPEESARRAREDAREETLPDGTLIDDEDIGEDGESVPLPQVLIPPPVERAPKGRKESRSGTKLAKSLADKMPGADKIKVYKRLEGRRHFIQDFTINDLATFPDAESFITRYIKPKYKAGEYDLVGVDALGRESERGTVRLIEDPSDNASETTGVLQMAERLFMEQRKRDEDLMKQTLSQQTSPLELLQGVLKVKKDLDEETGGAAKVAAEGQNTMLTMMMAMMQSNQQTMMALLTKPKEEDPLMKLILAKLIDGGGMGGGGAMPLPPPPPAEKKESVAELITALAAWQQATAPQGGGDEDYKELLKTLVLQSMQPKQDGLGGLSVKDVIELVTKGGSKNDLQAAVDNMALVMNMAQNLKQSTEPGAAAGFFDALAALFSNRDFAGSIAQTIRGKFDQRAVTEEERLKAVKQRLDMEARLVDRKRQQLEAGSAPASEPSPRQQQAAQRQQQPAQQKTPPRAPAQIPPLPGNTYEHVNAIVAATDEGGQVGKTIGMLVYFGEYEGPWKNYAERVLGLIRDGQKREALQFMAPLFESLVQLKMLEVEVAQSVLAAFDKHFSTVQEQLAELELAKDKAVTAENLTSPPPNAATDEAAAKNA